MQLCSCVSNHSHYFNGFMFCIIWLFILFLMLKNAQYTIFFKDLFSVFYGDKSWIEVGLNKWHNGKGFMPSNNEKAKVMEKINKMLEFQLAVCGPRT